MPKSAAALHSRFPRVTLDNGMSAGPMITPQNIELIRKYMSAHRSAMVDMLERLARVESPTHDAAAVDGVLKLLQNELIDSGMVVRRVRGQHSGGMLLAKTTRRTRRRPIQLLIGHCDTVWPVGTLASMPVESDDHQIRGPGVFDMKGGLVLMIYALRAVHELGLSTSADCVALINSDEEVGSPDSTRLISRLARLARRAFVLEPGFGLEGKLKTARKASGNFDIVIKGRAAHAGVNPEQGVSAILELSHQIQRLYALNNPAEGITINVGTIDGGLRPNVVAPEVRASVDVRVRTQDDAVRIENSIRQLKPLHPESTIEVTGGFSHPPMESNARNQSLWQQARQLGRQLGLELQDAAVGGASDGNTTSQFTATLDGLGVVGDGAHATHEFASVPHLEERCALLVLLLMAPLDTRECFT